MLAYSRMGERMGLTRLKYSELLTSVEVSMLQSITKPWSTDYTL